MFVVLVESSQWFGTGGVYFYWSAVYFRQGLNFYVIAPDTILRLPLNVVSEIFGDIILEEHPLVFDVLQTKLPNFSVVLFGA